MTENINGGAGQSAEAGDQEERVKGTKLRSPNYPAISLHKAVERAAEFEAKYKRATVPIGLVHALWGYKAHSSIGNQWVAAMKAYGLLDMEGNGNARKIRLSDSGYRIVRQGPDRAELLAKAALKPALHAELWSKYGQEGLSNDDLIKHYLLWEREEGKFNPESIDAFIGNFLDSLRFTGLLPGGINGTADSAGAKAEPVAEAASIAEGDFVQWTSQGVDFFAEPRKVLGFSDDGQYAFLEGEKTGAPVDQLSVQNPKGDSRVETKPPVVPPFNPFLKSADATPLVPGEVEERKIFDEGAAVLRWPDKLSPESVEDFDYWMKGILRRLRRKAGLPPE